VLVIEDRDIYAANIERALGSEHVVTIEKTAGKVVEGLRGVGADLVIVSLGLRDIDGLRLCSQIRSTEECRHTPLLILVEDTPDEMERLVKGLELGVNDYLIRPIDANELQARVRTQVKRKRYQDRLRANYEKSVELAVTDTLTGVYNRNYLETHLDNMVQRAVTNDRSMALALMDIDFFKRINDQHGHNAGDAVLREFAGRIQRGIRGIDLVARLGGEEFVVLMPDTDIDDAHVVAERLREGMESRPFLEDVMNGGLSVTVSIGVAPSLSGSDRATALLERADAALYEAKRGGRNKVILAADVTMAAVAQGS
jgi:two-component system cell cycle response regulator